MSDAAIDVKAMSSHPDAAEIAAAFHCNDHEVYDAFASAGQIIGNVPRRVAVAIMNEWFGDE